MEKYREMCGAEAASVAQLSTNVNPNLPLPA